MVEGLSKTGRKLYNKALHSIAFVPALMGVIFLLVAIATMTLDDIGFGLKLNQKYKWLTLKDAETARTIVATVAAGVISLMVFTFSMVMIIMAQAGSQMSNRMVDNIINNKQQKFILGFYTGTIVYSLFLLINISKTESIINVPSFSVYFLLVVTIWDIFLFIYFLHHITQSFRYEQLIQRIHDRAVKSLKQHNTIYNAIVSEPFDGVEVCSIESGFYQGFDATKLLAFAERHNVVVHLLHCRGTYVLTGAPLFRLSGTISDEDYKKIFLDIDFYYGQEIDNNFYYGFTHFTEVAVKALSPAINDPGTAVLCIDTLTDLFARIIRHPIYNAIKDKNGVVRVTGKEMNFEELFGCVMLPIWDYGYKDRLVREAIKRMIGQLMYIDKNKGHHLYLQQQLGELFT
jgi:uncharacterized membrane protein